MKFRLTVFCIAVLLALPFPALADDAAKAKDVAPVVAVPPAAAMPAADSATPPARAGPQSADAAKNPDEELESLVLQLVINNIQMEDFVDGGRKDGRLYLALNELAQLLDFDIKVDPVKKTAEGWFLHPENTLKLSETRAEVKGRSIDLPKDSVIVVDQNLLVDAKLLSDWMPLDFTFDDKNMVLGIHSREPLPMQEKAAREKLHAALEQQKALGVPGQAAYKQVDLPYAAVGVPYFDVTAGASYDSKSHKADENYTVLAAGDFSYLTTRLYATGDPGNHKMLSDLRLSAGRQSYEADLLGPLKATYFIGGDITSASLGQVASSSPGRGFLMTNRALNRSDKFDVTNFIGDAKPGWEIELYRNGTLIDFQTVDVTGRYKFMDIPILFGTNNFRLAFYGPQGQVEEITKTINAASSLLEQHQFTYNVSLDEKARSLSGLADSSTDPTTIRSVNEFEYGVTKYITVAGGAAHTVLTDGTQHTYGTADVRASAFGVLGSLDNAYDESNRGHSTQLSLFGDFKGTDLHFQQKVAHNFLSEGVTDLHDPIEAQTLIGANREIDFLFFKGLNLGLTVTRNRFQSGRVEDVATDQVSYSFRGLSLTNTINYDADNLGADNVNGTFALRGFYHKILLGGQLTYNLRPLTEFNQLNLTATWPFRENMVSDTQITQGFTGTKDTTLQETLTLDMKKYKLSFTGRGGTNNDYFAGVTMTTGFGPLPGTKKWLFSSQGLTGAGIVVVHAFMDNNYNQKRDPGEPAVDEATFRIAGREVKTDKDGMAMVTNLPTNDISTVKMDTAQGKDPFMAGASYEYHVVPREGRPVVIDYPVFEVSQLDGTVHGPEGASVGGLEVDLVNTEGQKLGSTHTAFDGYYLIQNISPGTYKLVISADDLAAHNLKQVEVRDLEVLKADFYTRDMELAATDAAAAVPVPPVSASAPAATTPPAAPAPAPAPAAPAMALKPVQSLVPPPAKMPEDKAK